MRMFLLPWYLNAKTVGASALTGEFTNYTPPYSYLLVLGSRFSPFGDQSTIKLISMCFDLAIVAASAPLLLRAQLGTQALLLGALFSVPTLAINSSVWGQCDSIYGFLCLATLALIASRRVLLAAVAFGIAISVKLQAIFIAPVVLAVAIGVGSLGQMIVAGALGILLALLPAMLAGRDLSSIASVYLEQSQAAHRLALGAPNPWSIVEWLWPGFPYETGVAIGLTTAAALGLVISWKLSERIRREGTANILLPSALMCAVLFPYVLPKMHERYFFLADILACILALRGDVGVALPLLVTGGSLFGYLSGPLGIHWLPALGAALNLLALLGSMKLLGIAPLHPLGAIGAAICSRWRLFTIQNSSAESRFDLPSAT
ncbi:MAG: glycosyltransferase 87 family protein [Gemmatimonadaceae bacterium]|nr:glycosyltransferase 87 family protein [Gemmatimonadaceae bacterium]